jgi:RNA polymerase sigma-70 factor (ECF subfamily)
LAFGTVAVVVPELFFWTGMATDETNQDSPLEDVRRGDHDAFRWLVEAHKNRVLNTCYRFVHDREDAEDLAQETFVEVHRSIARFRGDSDLATWIYRIAVTKSLDFIRKRDRAKRGGPLKRLLRLDQDFEGAPAPESSRPDAQLEDQERRRILQAALQALPKKQRIAFVLSKYDALSYKEIAAVLTTSVAAVESLIHRAKTSLQKRLADYYTQRE